MYKILLLCAGYKNCDRENLQLQWVNSQTPEEQNFSTRIFSMLYQFTVYFYAKIIHYKNIILICQFNTIKSHPAKKKYNHCNKIWKSIIVEEYDTHFTKSITYANKRWGKQKVVTRDHKGMLIHIMFGVMSGLMGSKCIMHTTEYHPYSSNACF